jgi:Lhr-like helicase
VIVSTSTLELGLDVGDLDRVMQIDVPLTVAAFPQPLGSSGRRMGTWRNCPFLAPASRRQPDSAGNSTEYKTHARPGKQDDVPR